MQTPHGKCNRSRLRWSLAFPLLLKVPSLLLMRCPTEEFPSSNVIFLGDKKQILMLKHLFISYSFSFFRRFTSHRSWRIKLSPLFPDQFSILSQHVAFLRLSKSSRCFLVNLLFTEQLLGLVLPELLTNT